MAEVVMIRGVVEALTKKYGGGFKVSGEFYNNRSGQGQPEQYREITATVADEKDIIHWEYGIKENLDWQKHLERRKKSAPTAPQNEKGEDEGDEIDAWRALYKEVDKIPELKDASEEEKRIVTSIIYKEKQENRRFKQLK